jgi:hypothetical protein
MKPENCIRHTAVDVFKIQTGPFSMNRVGPAGQHDDHAMLVIATEGFIVTS